jgi:hypothetical protein
MITKAFPIKISLSVRAEGREVKIGDERKLLEYFSEPRRVLLPYNVISVFVYYSYHFVVQLWSHQMIKHHVSLTWTSYQ